MKRICLASALVIAIISTSFEPASSQGFGTVYCTNCGTEWTQLANKATMVEQLVNQAQQLKDMLTNSNGLTNQVFGKAMQDINSLNSLMQQSSDIAFTAGNLDSQFATQFGTYSSYLTQKMGTSAWQNKYTQWSQQGSDNALYTLKGLGLQSSQMQNEDSLIQQLQGMASTATGRMEALQVANMVAAQNVDQLRKLRELIMLQLQMQANYMAAQQDKDAAYQAQRQNFLQWKTTPNTDGKAF